MVFKKILDHAIEHKAALIFAGGVATAIVGKKVLESGVVKETATNAMAGVISAKQDAEKAIEDMKKEAEEIAEE
ncbi:MULTISPECIES: hypothetical protein [unclassified Methanobrevibacter]|uniref:hypothetical protein n=1 Tax=unclassified Methanobrevibacter TaxID=2638681 RepID=UPI00273508B5|nr:MULTISPECIES: hypothetical protein [unclassified Methanobrevibacter]